MDNLKIIIKALESEFLACNDLFFTLPHANKILVDRGIFDEDDLSNRVLRHLLEENKIPNSSQTSTSPKQWRIYASESILEQRNKEQENNVIIKKKKSITKSSTSNNYYVTCPHCSSQWIIPPDIIENPILCCQYCGTEFINPFVKQPQINKPDISKEPKLVETVTKVTDINIPLWIGIIIFIIIIISVLSNNHGKSDDQIYIEQQKEIYKYKQEQKQTDEYFESLKEEARRQVDEENKK